MVCSIKSFFGLTQRLVVRASVFSVKQKKTADLNKLYKEEYKDIFVEKIYM